MPTTPAATADPWTEAVRKVEEDRGEPAGRQAKVEVPVQLKLSPDSRRFLAIQVAEWRQHHLETPHDFAHLVSMIAKGEFVDVPALGRAYILYGVGTSANEDPFTHYDKDSGKSVPLYADNVELQKEYDRINEMQASLKEAALGLKTEMQKAPKRDAALRKQLKAEMIENANAVAANTQRKELLNSFYGLPKSRALLASEYQTLSSFAHRIGQPAYDLGDGAARKALKIQLLSHLRPAALNVLQSLAQLYQEKFGRPLPITSLVRPDEYQRELHETNRNATLIDVPPHTTGLAFDVYYRYMTAAEQQFLMSELAKLHDGGKVEVLRENLNHYHVFVFIDGHPPGESQIADSMKDVPERATTQPKRERKARQNRRRKG